MDKTTNALNWFEICVADMNRAKTFYETVLGIEIEVSEMMGMKMGFFPAENGNGKVSGALVHGDMHQPSMAGSVIYLNANHLSKRLLIVLNQQEGKS
jgi:predicted enzyme related to lactoylglutathione lyase